MQELQQTLSHVLWIAGATDAGKTTIAQILAKRHELQIYNYDRHDLRHHECLAQTMTGYSHFLRASLDEQWIYPEPEDLLQRCLQSFRDRFALVVEDLLALPEQPMIVAEGFGFIPELLYPILSSQHQAIWLVPTEEFKWNSMKQRNKLQWRTKTSNPERATMNLFKRDMLLTQYMKTQAKLYNLAVYEVDGTHSAEEMTALVKQHFEPFFSQIVF